MKSVFLLLSVAMISFASNGQYAMTNKSFLWSIGIKPSIPFGHFSSYSNFGLGGSVQAEIKPHRVGITLNAGYIDYFGKTSNGNQYSDFRYIPVMAGAKYYLSHSSYLHAQIGPGFGTEGLGTSFWYGAGIGLFLSRAVDAELGYMGWRQHIIPSLTSTTTGSNGTYGGGTGGNPPTGGNGGYGGHYPTIDLKIGYNF